MARRRRAAKVPIFLVVPSNRQIANIRLRFVTKTLQNIVKRNIELVEYSDDPKVFLKNMLNSKLVSEVKINKREDGTLQAIVLVDPRKKGIVVGREGRNAEKARLLAKRYFEISSVLINSPERTTIEW